MSYNSRAYAKALAKAIANKKADSKRISANFLALLEKNHDVKKAGQILALAELLLLKASGNKKVTIESARELNIKPLVKLLVKRGDRVEEKIHPALVAGVKIIINDNVQLDKSLQGKLNSIFT